MSKRLTHIALHVQDKAASARFYTEWCGMVDSSPDPLQKSPWLSSPGKEKAFALVLVGGAAERRRQPLGDVTRMGVSVESRDALKALYARAQAGGAVHTAYEEKATGNRASFRAFDPDAYVLEFWTGDNPSLSRKFNNLSLHSKNLVESRRFYEDWCDLETFHHGRTGPSSRVATPGRRDDFQLILCAENTEGAPLNARDVNHIGMAVETEGELLDLYARAQSEGRVYWTLHTRPYPAGTLFSILDPDLHIVEFSYGQPLGDFTSIGQEGKGPPCRP